MKKFSLIAAVLLAGTAHATEMPQAANEMGCSNCHAIDHKVVGPAWIDVSKRYRDNRTNEAVFNQLVKKVSRGGFGNWGDIPMVANDPMGTRHEKIVELVKFILTLSDKLPPNQL